MYTSYLRTLYNVRRYDVHLSRYREIIHNFELSEYDASERQGLYMEALIMF